ncbi:3'(2'),5'-bisphosphate nucleotidase [Fontimonas thermophila]|uniref:3'(2'),5'-bisphosphate nucleotidase CysQ n=1 Tax=Fontimonas thermophila TaxID=1076937 RepID=A0A1I2KDN4_9GAMM|nr:3'(2'),5'-bisphosphate nucleotidase CysQ [Fontimonas thermophila]SFF63046.1 3'(2'),5'-bisphosphate nucleotidase [Fontimonas thermophila]
MGLHPDSSLLDEVIALARAAGERILDIYASDFTVSHKDDASPLTQADLASHRTLSAGLAKLTPGIPVLSEEGADTPFETRQRWRQYWLIDPLDGTKEFIQRNGEFTVNVALIENHTPVLGVVYAPVLNTVFAGARELGAVRILGTTREAVRTRACADRPVFVVSRSHKDAALDALLAKLPDHAAVSKGSSLKFCLVASGEADLYPRTGPTSEWDTAAGQCVVECAGGEVLRLPDLAPLRYNQKDSLLNPGFVVIGDPHAGWRERLRAAG